MGGGEQGPLCFWGGTGPLIWQIGRGDLGPLMWQMGAHSAH
jgi:hypothetical protein